MRKLAILAAVLFFVVAATPAKMQDDIVAETDIAPVTVPNTHSIPLSSSKGYEYVLSIALPDSYYTSEQTYPVIYLLDQTITFLTVTEFVRFMATGATPELPELIVVGVGYPSLEDELRYRDRDYFSAPDDFLDFMSDELFPLVDSNYRTISDDRAIMGFSLGGHFVFHSFLTRPELFKRYIAIDSGVAGLMPLLMRDDEEFRSTVARFDRTLVIAVRGTEMLSAGFQARNYEGLATRGVSLGNVTHIAALHLSIPPGILGIYCGERQNTQSCEALT